MTEEEIKRIVVEELCNLTPETDPAKVAADADIREALDFDSMDILNLVTALHKRLGVDIPEVDYPKVMTIGGAVAYMLERARTT